MTIAMLYKHTFLVALWILAAAPALVSSEPNSSERATSTKRTDHLVFRDQMSGTEMEIPSRLLVARRYKVISEEKANGATYTPKRLADFVAQQMTQSADLARFDRPLRVLDPAVGDGELLISLLEQLERLGEGEVAVFGFETDAEALSRAKRRLSTRFPQAAIHFEEQDFLSFGAAIERDMFKPARSRQFDFIIANPPYVRTQVMGADQAQRLAREFGLTGRVDLYYAFILAIAASLEPKGIAGIITSNRFMTTRSGAAVRRAVLDNAVLKHVWDLGDSKLFDAAVLPAILLVEGKNGNITGDPLFTSIYETKDEAHRRAGDAIEALQFRGVVATKNDNRRFLVRHGTLKSASKPDAVWTIATKETDAWLETVAAHTWNTFGALGRIRVGIKTTADKVFIRKDWSEMESSIRPELLRPLATHHIARRFRALNATSKYEVLYPHLSRQGRRYTAELSQYPKMQRYLEQHRASLEGRSYVIEAGRAWYEIWVPQDPEAWSTPKLVFRDISHKPIFWLDFDGSVVNGDCYWLTCSPGTDCDLLWLAAAVANSTFMEVFYDHKFHNKLYAGRRRFITQYVEQFPLPNPESRIARTIIRTAKEIYQKVDSPAASALERKLNELVWSAFGLPIEEITR